MIDVFNILRNISGIASCVFICVYMLLFLCMLLQKKKAYYKENNVIVQNILSNIPCKIEITDNIFSASFNSAHNTIYCRQKPEEVNNILDASIILHEYYHSVDYSEHKTAYENRVSFNTLTLITTFLLPVLCLFSIIRLIFSLNIGILINIIVLALLLLCVIQYIWFCNLIFKREFRVYRKTRKLTEDMSKSNKKNFGRVFNLDFLLLITERCLMFSVCLFVFFVTLGGM